MSGKTPWQLDDWLKLVPLHKSNCSGQTHENEALTLKNKNRETGWEHSFYIAPQIKTIYCCLE